MKKTIIVGFLLVISMVGCLADQESESSFSENEMPTYESVSTEIEPTSTNVIVPTSLPTIEPTSVPGIINISSTPQGAEITVSETEINDVTPYSTNLASGHYTVTLNLEGYQLWEENILVLEGETLEIQVELEPIPLIIGKYTPLVELGGIGNISEIPFLAYAGWESESDTFLYALDKGVNLAETKDWNWWRYDNADHEIQSINSPESLVNEETRNELEICPLNHLAWDGPASCSDLSFLFENRENNLILYSPLRLEDFPSIDGELWIANTDGTGTQKLADFAPAYAHWSSDGQWLTTGMAFAGLPGQAIHYLIKTDGTFVERLQDIIGVDSFYLNGLFPQFSPDGQKLLLAGSMVPDSRRIENYGLYVLDLNSLELQLVTQKFGLFQWEPNGNGIYVLDGAFTPFDALEIGSLRTTDLYYVEIGTHIIQEHMIASGIPYYSPTNYGSWNWAYSPTSQTMIFVGYSENNELGILQLKSPLDK